MRARRALPLQTGIRHTQETDGLHEGNAVENHIQKQS
jgi:hypothetical protein